MVKALENDILALKFHCSCLLLLSDLAWDFGLFMVLNALTSRFIRYETPWIKLLSLVSICFLSLVFNPAFHVYYRVGELMNNCCI